MTKRKPRKLTTEQFRALSEPPNAYHNLQKAYGSLKQSYSNVELDLLEAVLLLGNMLDRQNVRELVVRYVGRILGDSNFREAMQSKTVMDRVLMKVPWQDPKNTNEFAAHTAMAKLYDFTQGSLLGGKAAEGEVLDFNLLQHLPRGEPSISSEVDYEKAVRNQERRAKKVKVPSSGGVPRTMLIRVRMNKRGGQP